MCRKFLLLTCVVLLGLASNGLANMITGTITVGGSGLSGVVLTASGGTQGTTTSVPSNASGQYTANHSAANPVTVTPSKAGYTFSPATRTYNITYQSPSGQNYTATLLTYTITGNVGTLVGVTMNGLPGNPVTTSGGAYTATVGYGWNGTVTPAMTGYSFSPVSKTYTNVTANQSAQNYTPSAITYTISGSVGTLDGVTMNGLPGNPVTSGGGLYSATVAGGWSGTVTPSKSPYGFNPSQMTYTNVTANQTNQNYGTIADVQLLGQWKFDDSTANDNSGYGHNGTLTGNATIVDDAERGKVLSLDGNGDYVDLGNGSWTNPGNNLTVTAWIKVNAFDATWQTVIAKGVYTYRISRNENTSAMCTYMNYAGTTNSKRVNGTSTVNDGAWHFVGASYNGTTMKLYVDNQVQGTNSLDTLYTTTDNLCIGRNVYQASRDWYGWIDDVRLYSRTLSDAEMESIAGTSYTISGSVGTLDGVTMNGLPGNPVTSGGGNYSATVAYGWDGTVTPTKNGYTFTPASVTYTNVISNKTQSYTAIVPTCTISGTVGTLDDVVMSGFPVETITVGGSYSATVNSGWTGTITPSKEGYTFSPTNKTYSNVTSNQSQNYTPSLITYTISGHVGTLDGVTMNGLPGNPVTSGGGAYSATVTYIWSGTVTPAKTGYTFTPSSRMYSNIGSNLTEDYTPIINTYTISGYAGTVSGVTMSGLPNSPLSTTGGAYSDVVTYGWTGTVTPTKSLYNFTPANKTYSNVTANQDNQNYSVSTALGDASLVGWWPLNGNATDYSGYGHNGTVTGASYVTSDIGTVLEFDGADYVAIPSSTFATINSEVTIALWANGDAAFQPQNNSIFEGTRSGSRTLNAHIPWSDSKVYFDAGYAGTTYDRISKTATTANFEGQWNHWVFTKDLSTEQMKIYLNGVLWTSGTAKSKSMSGINVFKIGSIADGTSNYDGMISDFRIYDRVLSDAEIGTLYNASYEVTVPSPADQATDVATSADISWTKGYLAADTSGHDVYFGTDVTLVTTRAASVHKGLQTGTTYDPGTLTNGVTYFWAVDEVNDFYENSPWMGDVYSFTVIGSAQACPICGGAGLCDLQVQNYNSRLGKISGRQRVNLINITMDGKTSQSMTSCRNAVNAYINFCNRASYGFIELYLGSVVSHKVPVSNYSKAQSYATSFSKTLPDALVTVCFYPKGVASFSHAGAGRAMMAGTNSRDVIHEAGHIMGLAHSNKNIDGVFDSSGDPSSFMSSLPSQNYAVNQQHWLNWTRDVECIKITDCLNKVPYIDVPIRPINGGGNGLNSTIPITYCYEIPNSDQRLWISVPKSVEDSGNKIKGGEIFIHRSVKCIGCTGMAMNSTLIGRIYDATKPGPKNVSGLIINPIAYQGTTQQFNGHSVINFSQITLRLSIEGGPVADNNDYTDVDTTPIAKWEFAESAGTTLRNTINDGLTDPATWSADRAGITVTGDEVLNFAPNTNTMDGSVSYFNLAGADSALTSGRAWTVIEINDFNFAGATVGERLHFGLMNAMTNTSLTAECQIRRNANNSVHLIGYATGTVPGTGVQISNTNAFNGLLEICTEFDFDVRTYQVFYRFNGTGEWNSAGPAAAMNGTNVGNALRLCSGETASTGTGSWRDTNEYFHIDRIFVTKVNPMIAPPNNAPHVWISYPDDGDSFSAGSNITIQSSAVDTDGNVTGVEFYNGSTLLGSGTPPTVQNDVIKTAATATIHGSTASYNSSQNAIISWTNMADWLSWTPSIARTGTFEVWVNYSCANSSAGSTYRVEVDGQIVQGTVTGTGTDWTNYDSVSLGTVELTQTGTINLNVVPEDKPGAAVMNLRDVTLIPQQLDTCYQYTWNNVSAGTYTLTTKATDDLGATSVSDPIVIHVQ